MKNCRFPISDFRLWKRTRSGRSVSSLSNRQSAIGNRQSGFTLIELLVVIAVISILAAILLPAIRVARENTRRQTTRVLISQVGMALTQYSDAYGEYPPERIGSGPTFYSSECLVIFLDRRKVGVSGPGIPPAEKAEFLQIKSTFLFNSNPGTQCPELVDAWGLPILYNRLEFPNDSSHVWSDTIPPVHNIKTYDIFSGNTDGVRILGNPWLVGLNTYENNARSISGYQYVNERRQMGRRMNEYIGNW